MSDFDGFPAGLKPNTKNGVLKITLPKKEMAKPRQIKVAVNVN